MFWFGEYGEGVPLPSRKVPGPKKWNFSLEMACFGEFWAVFFQCFARKVLNFPPEAVILWTLKVFFWVVVNTLLQQSHGLISFLLHCNASNLVLEILKHDRIWGTICISVPHSNNNNSNNNNQDDIYGAVIMAEPVREFTRFIWWMQTKHRPAANPQTKPTDLDCESARKKWQLPSTSTISILLLLSPRADTHFTVPRRVEGWVDLGTAVRVCSPCPRLYIAALGCRDKQNCPRWDSNLGPLTPQSGMLPLGHCDIAGRTWSLRHDVPALLTCAPYKFSYDKRSYRVGESCAEVYLIFVHKIVLCVKHIPASVTPDYRDIVARGGPSHCQVYGVVNISRCDFNRATLC